MDAQQLLTAYRSRSLGFRYVSMTAVLVVVPVLVALGWQPAMDWLGSERALLVLAAHEDGVELAVFSPDGTRVATASRDKTARLWDARSGAPLAVMSGHTDEVTWVAFSPDGTRVVTASSDMTARLWDARSGAALAVLAGHEGPVQTAAFSPDGTQVVTASGDRLWEKKDRTVRLWDARSGAALAVLVRALKPHWSAHQFSAVFSPDGTRIAAVLGGEAYLLDPRGQMKPTQLAIPDANTIVFSPDGSLVVTAAKDGDGYLWDAASGAKRADMEGHLASAELSADGSRVVTASFDGTARLWDARIGRHLTVVAVLPGIEHPLRSASFSPDGTRVVTVSQWDPDTRSLDARLWDARSGAALTRLRGHGRAVSSARFSPDGTRVVTASDDGTARLWDAHGKAAPAN